jgi:hypothetical protein
MSVMNHLKGWQVLAAVAVCCFGSAIVGAQGTAAPKRLADITLDSGVTLEDWLRLVSTREPQPSLETAGDAARYVRRYGAFRELLDLVHRASEGPEFDRTTLSSRNASQVASRATEARRLLGDWPNLLLVGGMAKAHANDTAGAVADLRKWMTLAPRDHIFRSQVADALLLAERAPSAITEWVRAFEPVEVPPQYVSRKADPEFLKLVDPAGIEMARAARCMGSRNLFSDLNVDFKIRAGAKPWPDFGNHYVQWNGLTWNANVEKLFALSTQYGPVWSRKVYEETAFQTRAVDVSCSTPPGSVAPGSKFHLSWREISERRDNGELSTATQTRKQIEVEITSTALDSKALAALAPYLRVDPAVATSIRIFPATVRDTQQVVPEGGAAPAAPTQSPARQTLFVEGPNIVLFPFGLSEPSRGHRVVVGPIK